MNHAKAALLQKSKSVFHCFLVPNQLKGALNVKLFFCYKLLFCKIQIHYRRHKKWGYGDLKRGKLNNLNLNQTAIEKSVELKRKASKAHLSQTRKTSMQEEQTCTRSVINTHKHTHIKSEL